MECAYPGYYDTNQFRLRVLRDTDNKVLGQLKSTPSCGIVSRRMTGCPPTTGTQHIVKDTPFQFQSR